MEDWSAPPRRRYPGAGVVKGVGKGLSVLCWPVTGLLGLATGRRRRSSSEYAMEDFDAAASYRTAGPGAGAGAWERGRGGRKRGRGGLGADLALAWGAAPGLTAGAVLLAGVRAAARVGFVVLLGYAVENSALNDAFDIGMGGRSCCAWIGPVYRLGLVWFGLFWGRSLSWLFPASCLLLM